MGYYNSPRWSGEILDCSMPMTFDTYDRCSYNCLYCFSYFQKIKSIGEDYQNKDYVKYVNKNKIIKIFNLELESQFSEYIKKRYYFQWGGLADQFDEYERIHGKSLELLKFFKKINYPICFSTKSTWWAEEKNYIDIFRDQKNWNIKISIINLDKTKAALMEEHVDSPQKRLEAIKLLSNLNIGGVTLRLRPFIIGYTDKNNEYINLIDEAYKNGATAVSTEFLCLDCRADEKQKQRYNKISEIIGYDIFDFYKHYSSGVGYYRLNYKLKSQYIEKMKSICDKLGMRFYVSDAHHKEKSHNGSCCGLDSSCNYFKGQMTEALCIAREKGLVSFSNIEKYLDIFIFKWHMAEGLNTTSVLRRTLLSNFSMKEWIRKKWNEPNNKLSPYKYFNGVLKPVAIDENKNVVYKYMLDYTKKNGS